MNNLRLGIGGGSAGASAYTGINGITVLGTEIDGIQKQDKSPVTLQLSDFTSNTVLGSAETTVDIYEKFEINQTTSGISLTLPNLTASNPIYPNNRKIIYISNIGSQTIIVNNIDIPIGKFISFQFNGSSWETFSQSSATSSVNSIAKSFRGNNLDVDSPAKDLTLDEAKELLGIITEEETLVSEYNYNELSFQTNYESITKQGII